MRDELREGTRWVLAKVDQLGVDVTLSDANVAYRRISDRARAMVEKSAANLSFDEAVVRVLQQTPELYDVYEEALAKAQAGTIGTRQDNLSAARDLVAWCETRLQQASNPDQLRNELMSDPQVLAAFQLVQADTERRARQANVKKAPGSPHSPPSRPFHRRGFLRCPASEGRQAASEWGGHRARDHRHSRRAGTGGGGAAGRGTEGRWRRHNRVGDPGVCAPHARRERRPEPRDSLGDAEGADGHRCLRPGRGLHSRSLQPSRSSSFLAVQLCSDGVVVSTSAAGEGVIGIAQDNAQPGQAVSVQFAGVTKAWSDGLFDVGALLSAGLERPAGRDDQFLLRIPALHYRRGRLDAEYRSSDPLLRPADDPPAADLSLPDRQRDGLVAGKPHGPERS